MTSYIMKCLCVYGLNPDCDNRHRVIIIYMKVKKIACSWCNNIAWKISLNDTYYVLHMFHLENTFHSHLQPVCQLASFPGNLEFRKTSFMCLCHLFQFRIMENYCHKIKKLKDLQRQNFV